MNNQLKNKLDRIETRGDLSKFILALQSDFEKNKEEWENASIDSFLEAMSAWIEDMDGYYKNQGQDFSEEQPWKMFAEILLASKIYE